MALVNYYILVTGELFVVEITLAFLALLLGGACVFIFLFYSMSHDREEVIAKHIHNPWERINPQERSRAKRRSAFPKHIVILLSVLASLFVLILIILAILLLFF